MAKLRATPNKPDWPFVLNYGSPQSQGLVGWWPDGPTNVGKLWDLSGKGNNLTISGPTSVAGNDGGKGARLYVKASNQYCESAVIPVSVMPLTLTCWIKAVSLNSNTGVVSICNNTTTANRYSILHQNTGTVNAICVDGAVTVGQATSGAGNVISVGKWSFCAGIFTGLSARQVFLNGQLGALETTTLTTPTGMNAFEIGRARVDNSIYADAVIEDVRVYNRALSVGDLMAMYEPPTRWQLRYQPGRTKYFIVSPASQLFTVTSVSQAVKRASYY